MKKGRGRPKVVLIEVVKNGYVNWGSTKSMALDIIEWLVEKDMWPALANCWGFMADSKNLGLRLVGCCCTWLLNVCLYFVLILNHSWSN